jgi:hypothetical protein
MNTASPVSASVTQALIAFINSIGISVHRGAVPENSFLPGLMIDNGAIIMDEKKLSYPGDLLHEAAHIAVVPSAERHSLHNDNIPGRKDRDAEEMMAIAWSYAACRHLQINPLVVFHDEGYQGGGSHIAESFNRGEYFGVPMLQWTGMAGDPKQEGGYPKMLAWLRP